jgi:hypothetical protein
MYSTSSSSESSDTTSFATIELESRGEVNPVAKEESRGATRTRFLVFLVSTWVNFLSFLNQFFLFTITGFGGQTALALCSSLVLYYSLIRGAGWRTKNRKTQLRSPRHGPHGFRILTFGFSRLLSALVCYGVLLLLLPPERTRDAVAIHHCLSLVIVLS